MSFVFANGKWMKDGKVVTAAEVRAATKPVQKGYSGSFLPDHDTPKELPNNPEARAAEMSQRVLESGYHGSVDNVPLWRKGERRMYDGDSGDGIHTFAELMEIEDDMKHAYD